jgi:hypothetical protein
MTLVLIAAISVKSGHIRQYVIRLSEITVTHPVFRTRFTFLDFRERGIGIHMAGASAVAKLFYAVEGVGINILLMFTLSEFILVAGSAIRLVLR